MNYVTHIPGLLVKCVILPTMDKYANKTLFNENYFENIIFSETIVPKKKLNGRNVF